MAAKKAAKPLNEPAKQAEPTASGSSIYLDPQLAEIREQEKARNSVEISPRSVAEIDPALTRKSK